MNIRSAAASLISETDGKLIVGAVTFLDVLGWKGIWQRDRDALSKLKMLVKRVEDAVEENRGKSGVDKTAVQSISDTIAIFTEAGGSAAQAAIELHGLLCAEAIATSIAAEIPVRGATSFGEFQMSESFFVGKAIDEAASWYETTDWIGVHMTPSAQYVFDSTKSEHWIDYLAPIKSSPSMAPCVRWLPAWAKREAGAQDPLRGLKDVFRSLGPIVPEIAAKFRNTLSFAETMLPDSVHRS